MGKRSILDCTLRDGGYITNWYFSQKTISNLIEGLTAARLDYVEIGYINPAEKESGKSIFKNLQDANRYLPSKSKNTMYMAMMDCAQIGPLDVTPYSEGGIEGIRVVFYKHQVDEAMELCKSVKENGYKLFVQPMVTIDYSIEEYGALIQRVNELKPYAISIVDSFGYMGKKDFRTYFDLLDKQLIEGVKIGFHSHNNMQLAFVTAQDILEYETDRDLIIDASLLGMGRGAGNLNTEIITNYYNGLIENKYDLSKIIELISDEIKPIKDKHTWGYSPYLFLTGLYHCHPNFACFLLEKYDVSVEEFERFIQYIPKPMLTKCRRTYVEELYEKMKNEECKNEE